MPREGEAVLGIDAAWTDGQPSGIALLQRCGSKWRCLRLAPSCGGFCDGFAWSDQFVVAGVDVDKLLAACRRHLGDAEPAAVAVDMPLATTPINRRRHADDLVSQHFGHCKCAVHSPTAERPGPTGRRLQRGFIGSGYALATTTHRRTRVLLEVYPHVALLGLTGRSERLPYKASKTNTYWRGRNAAQRKRQLIEEWQLILARLGAYIDDIDMPLPNPCKRSFEYLKRFEDAIDSLVCAWVATQFLDRAAEPLGDDEAAIWIPTLSMQFARAVP